MNDKQGNVSSEFFKVLLPTTAMTKSQLLCFLLSVLTIGDHSIQSRRGSDEHGGRAIVRQLGHSNAKVDSYGKLAISERNDAGELLALVNEPKFLNTLDTTLKTSINASLEELAQSINAQRLHPTSKGSHERVVTSMHALETLMKSKLTTQQLDHLKDILSKRRAALGISKGVEVDEVRKLLKHRKFWTEIAERSFAAKREAVQSILDCLDEEQLGTLMSFVDDQGIVYAVHAPCDLLHFQLEDKQKRKTSELKERGVFRDMMFLGSYVYDIEGELSYRYFANASSTVPVMVKMKLCTDRNFEARIALVDDQLNEISDLMSELQSERDRIRKKLDELGVSMRELDTDEMALAESRISERFETILLPHQKQMVEAEVAAQLLPRLGLKWSLTNGNLGRLLKVTESQSKSIEESAKFAAKKLKEDTDLIHLKLSELLTEESIDLPHHLPQQYDFLQFRCVCPENVIPLSARNFSGKTLSLFEMKNKFGSEQRNHQSLRAGSQQRQ